MDSDINKRAEIYNVSNRSRQYHIGLEVFHIEYIIAQNGRLEGIAQIASGLFELADNIKECRLADAELIRNSGSSLSFYLAAKLAELARADVKTVMLTEEKYSVRIFLSDTQFVEVLSAVYREIFDVLRENNWNVT